MNKKLCPICGYGRSELVVAQVWDSKKRKVYKCFKCSTIYLSPMMTDKEMGVFYEQYDKHVKKRTSSDKEYIKIQKNVALSAKRQTGLLKGHLNKNQTFCDIGAFKGDFLRSVRPYVKEIIAVEPSVDNILYLNARKIRNYKWLEDVDSRKLKFDAISMFHTFEHLNDPLGYLKNLKRYLNPGALVFIEVPNVDDALLRLYKSEPFKKFYFQSMHCFYYNPETLAGIFKRGGFKMVKTLPIQRYGISNHLNWLVNNKPGGNIVFDAMFADLDGEYRKVIAQKGFSDTILAVFKKL